MKDAIDALALFPELNMMRDNHLRDSVIEIYEALWSQSGWEHVDDVPVSLKIAYPQRKHAQGVVRVALAAAAVWEEVHGTTIDRDVLIAGALLMDVSKFVETAPGPTGPVGTEISRHLPHATITAHMALERDLPLDVVHIVLAHSPNGGKAPATVECQILDWIDQADISAFGREIWSRKVYHFQP